MWLERIDGHAGWANTAAMRAVPRDLAGTWQPDGGRIDRDAVKSATRQLTRTLLLSNDAEAHAKPELHIDCDDVEASHGATVGQLDPMEQFYLESRGIAPEDARRMLIRAFVDKQLAFAPAPLRAGLAAAVAERLGGDPAASEVVNDG